MRTFASTYAVAYLSPCCLVGSSWTTLCNACWPSFPPGTLIRLAQYLYQEPFTANQLGACQRYCSQNESQVKVTDLKFTGQKSPARSVLKSLSGILLFIIYFRFTVYIQISQLLASSVQFSRSVVSDSLRPHELQHARPPCPSPTPGVHSNSCPSSRWCHPAISSSVIPFSSCPQSLPASGSFPMSQLFAWGGQSTGVSALASFLPKNTQDWSPLEWTGWISLQSKELSRVFSNTTVQKLGTEGGWWKVLWKDSERFNC